MKQLTLVFVIESNRVLLGYKKRGFGSGRFNGFGGKVEPNESLEAAALRELQEEAGIIADNLESVGTLEFSFVDNEDRLQVHLFVTTQFEGVPVETEEMRPEWFVFSDVPYEHMWPDDRYWLPQVLQGERCQGSFHFDTASTPTYTSQIIEY